MLRGRRDWVEEERLACAAAQGGLGAGGGGWERVSNAGDGGVGGSDIGDVGNRRGL